jgi:hypothetical protein
MTLNLIEWHPGPVQSGIAVLRRRHPLYSQVVEAIELDGRAPTTLDDLYNGYVREIAGRLEGVMHKVGPLTRARVGGDP